ncbi:hypothetical protein QC762_305070 [Podospora pseudocomata]|uniref:F-box domain-containing protein n=1 Tax=Podospora pseudocomata TaxID=2093779 RepID=A0ABR0GJ30_9PEZI|nr:hypothetical protein QC762_305070 [Podospora pseudocomata]
MKLFSQIVSQPTPMAAPVVETGQQRLKGRLVLDELPVEIVVEIATNLDFEGFGSMLAVSSFMRCILQKYWRYILSSIIEREFTPVGLFFQAFETGEVTGVGNRSAREWLGRLTGVGGGRDGRDREMDRIMNFCRGVKLWEAEFQRFRFYDCDVGEMRLMNGRERERFRRGLFIWDWFARVHHAGRQTRRTAEPVAFMRRFSTTELHELNDVWETVWAAVGREVCPSVTAVMEVIGDRSLAERIGWGDGEENRQILGTVMKLGPGDLLRLLVGGGGGIGGEGGWIEDTTEALSMAVLSVRHEREKMMGMERSPFPVEGFPGRYGGVLDHEMEESEELRVVHGADGGREGPYSGRYIRGSGIFLIGGVRVGRLVAGTD